MPRYSTFLFFKVLFSSLNRNPDPKKIINKNIQTIMGAPTPVSCSSLFFFMQYFYDLVFFSFLLSCLIKIKIFYIGISQLTFSPPSRTYSSSRSAKAIADASTSIVSQKSFVCHEALGDCHIFTHHFVSTD
jgi:hypothetical protein